MVYRWIVLMYFYSTIPRIIAEPDVEIAPFPAFFFTLIPNVGQARNQFRAYFHASQIRTENNVFIFIIPVTAPHFLTFFYFVYRSRPRNYIVLDIDKRFFFSPSLFKIFEIGMTIKH